MTAATDYTESNLLDHLLGTTAMTMPTGTFVKLHTGIPGESAASNAFGDARRIDVTFGATNATTGIALNSTTVTWTASTAAGTITYFSIWDASTGGNPLIVGDLGAGAVVAIDDDITIAIGDLSVTLA